MLLLTSFSQVRVNLFVSELLKQLNYFLKVLPYSPFFTCDKINGFQKLLNHRSILSASFCFCYGTPSYSLLVTLLFASIRQFTFVVILCDLLNSRDVSKVLVRFPYTLVQRSIFRKIFHIRNIFYIAILYVMLNR